MNGCRLHTSDDFAMRRTFGIMTSSNEIGFVPVRPAYQLRYGLASEHVQRQDKSNSNAKDDEDDTGR